MDLHELLRFAVENNASDAHIQAVLPPRLRIGVIIRGVNMPVLTDEVVRNFIKTIAPKRMQDDVDDRIVKGLDFSLSVPNLSRFRCSAYQHLGTAGITMRIVR